MSTECMIPSLKGKFLSWLSNIEPWVKPQYWQKKKRENSLDQLNLEELIW
jgi:hypothetical protein